MIRAEKASGTRRDGRTELQVLLDFLRPGDALVITRIDRLARSLKDLQDIVHELKERRVALRATEQPINTDTAAGKAFLDMLGVFAEFETNLRKERQAEGIAAAKARGVYKGRKPKIDSAAVHKLRYEEKLGPADIARRLQFRPLLANVIVLNPTPYFLANAAPVSSDFLIAITSSSVSLASHVASPNGFENLPLRMQSLTLSRSVPSNVCAGLTQAGVSQ